MMIPIDEELTFGGVKMNMYNIAQGKTPAMTQGSLRPHFLVNLKGLSVILPRSGSFMASHILYVTNKIPSNITFSWIYVS